MKQLTFGSLFAGIGGFDLGYHQAGMRCAWQVEIDQAARSVLAHHWPETPRLADVRDCGAHNLAPVDVMSFGFPCQDLSVAGNRAGLAGKRSGLFYEATRIADELRPMLLTWENVPGLLSSNSGRDFAAVLMELERVGYVGGWTTLDAQWFGVAQRRQRVFGVFARADLGAAVCAEILSLTTRMSGHTQTRPEARADVARGITASAGHHGRSSPRGDGSDNLIAHTLTSGNASGVGVNKPGRRREDDYNIVPAIALSNRGHADDVAETLRSDCHGAQPMVGYYASAFGGYTEGAGTLRAAGGDNGAGSEILVAATLNSGGNNGGFRTEPGEHIIAVSVSENQRGELRTSDIAAQLTVGGGKPGQGYPAVLAFTERTRAEGRTLEVQDDLAYALTNPGSGGRTHSRQIAGGFGVRRLTPTECERLQGFPDGWTAISADGPQSDSARYRQLGNAVCVRVSAWLGKRIIKCVKRD